MTFEDARVNLVLLDFRLGIDILDAENDTLRVVIGTSFGTRVAPHTAFTTLDPEENTPALGALAVSLRHQQVRKCLVTKQSNLELEFESGLTIEVASDLRYEAWQLDNRCFTVVAMPGGKLAIWDRTS